VRHYLVVSCVIALIAVVALIGSAVGAAAMEKALFAVFLIGVIVTFLTQGQRRI
jgi:hypothetical protein